MFYFTCNESKIYESFTFWKSYKKKWTFSRHSNLLRCTCTPKSPYECVRLELVGVSHSLEPMEELKQTMRDVGRHMLNDPPSGAQRSRWRVNLGKCWLVESSCSHQCHWSSTRSSLLETRGVSEHVYIIVHWSISWHQCHSYTLRSELLCTLNKAVF